MYNGMRLTPRTVSRVSAARAKEHGGRFRSPRWTLVAMRPWHVHTAQPPNPATELRLTGVLGLRLRRGVSSPSRRGKASGESEAEGGDVLIDSGP